MVLLKDYLNSTAHNRRILIVNDLGRGQALIRKHEAETGEIVRNVTCMTVGQIVDSIYKWTLSETNHTTFLDEIDSTEAMMLFRSVLLRNLNRLKYFNQEKMMNLSTTQEIFNKVNLVRSNGWNENESNEPRIMDLKLLVSEFEELLKKSEKIDSIRKTRLVLSAVSGWHNVTEEVNNLFGADISYLSEDIETFTGIQLEILSQIVGSKDKSVDLFDKTITIEELTKFKDRSIFYRGYGVFNEANYIANDILEKNLPLGEVSVLFSSSTQIPAITSALRGNGIRMNILSKYNAQDNPYIALAKRIIEWAAEDYSEKALENVLSSPVISIMLADETGKEENILAKQSYFDFVVDAKNRRENNFVLGWGFERNNDFIVHEKSIVSDEKVLACLEMLSEMLSIFREGATPYSNDNKVRPIEIYKRIIDFVVKHSRHTEEYPLGTEALKRLSDAIAYEERNLSLDENLKFIDELLSGITIVDEEKSDAVSVRCMNNWALLERPYVYVIGLSLKDMQGNTTQSPVLFDEEIESLLNKGYKPTIKAEADRREKNLHRTLMTFDGNSISFGYSSYDTTGFCESNPSNLYRELLSSFTDKKISEICEFVYGNPKNGIGTTMTSNYKKKPIFDIKHQTSSTSLETFLDCPKKYAYDKLMHIPNEEYVEKDYSQWLNAAQKGNFFHEIAEKYVSEKLIKPATEVYDWNVDKNLIEQSADEIKNKLLSEMPVALRDIADRETKDIIKDAVRYFERLLIELQDDSNHPGSFWRAVATEQYFQNAKYSIEAFDGSIHDFELTGYVDRIDYRIDRPNKKVYLRIIDYKTGKKESKEKANELGKLIQYTIYEKALMESGKFKDENDNTGCLLDMLKEKIAELESDATIANWNFEFDSFTYVFPMEQKDLEPIVIYGNELETINVIRLKTILTMMKAQENYPSHKELYLGLGALKKAYPKSEADIDGLEKVMTKLDRSKNPNGISDSEIKNCEYCSYCNLCVDRKVEI